MERREGGRRERRGREEGERIPTCPRASLSDPHEGCDQQAPGGAHTALVTIRCVSPLNPTRALGLGAPPFENRDSKAYLSALCGHWLGAWHTVGQLLPAQVYEQMPPAALGPSHLDTLLSLPSLPPRDPILWSPPPQAPQAP